MSDGLSFLSGVSESSVLGSLTFTTYTDPTEIIAQQHAVKYHLCTDNIKLCISVGPDNELNCSSSSKDLERCNANIPLWTT